MKSTHCKLFVCLALSHELTRALLSTTLENCYLEYSAFIIRWIFCGSLDADHCGEFMVVKKRPHLQHELSKDSIFDSEFELVSAEAVPPRFRSASEMILLTGIYRNLLKGRSPAVDCASPASASVRETLDCIQVMYQKTNDELLAYLLQQNRLFSSITYFGLLILAM